MVKKTYTARCLLLLVVFQLMAAPGLFAQKKNAGFELHIRRASSPMVIDGFLDEAAWQSADKVGDFFMVMPMDLDCAHVQTAVRMTYDDRYLYLAAECYNGLPGPDMVESLRRDFAFLKNDNFIFFRFHIDRSFADLMPSGLVIGHHGRLLCQCRNCKCRRQGQQKNTQDLFHFF